MQAVVPAVNKEEYREDGFAVVRRVFEPREMEGFQGAWRDIKMKMQSGELSLQRNARFVIGRLPDPLGSICRHSHLVAIARQLLGEDLALYYNRLLVKDKVWSGAVEIHQDMPFFHGHTNKLSVFVPLAPFNESTGGLKILTGSHRWGNLGVRGAIKINEFPAMRLACPAVEPGDILLMDFLTWHYSEAPTVPCERPVLQIVYQPADDGSYVKEGLEEPTLVSGEWRTTHFTPLGHGIEPYQVAPPPPASTDHEAAQLRAQVAEREAEITVLKESMEGLRQQCASWAGERQELTAFRQAVEASAGWRLLNSWRRLRDRVAPEASRRRRLYESWVRYFRRG